MPPFMLEPYELGKASAAHNLHVERKAKDLKSLPRVTITRSLYSEHEFKERIYGNELGHKFKGVSWFTLAPYAKGPRRKR